MRCNAVLTGSDTFKFNMTVFEKNELEELLHFIMSFKMKIVGMGTTTVAGRLPHPCNISLYYRSDVIKFFVSLIENH